MTATLTDCGHGTAYPTEQAARDELVRRRTRGALSSGQAPRLEVRECTSGGWHVTRPRRSTVLDAAHHLVAELKALDPSVDAVVVPGLPCGEDACQHSRGCDRPDLVLTSTVDSLNGEPVDTGHCYEHAVTWVRWLLEDGHRRDHDEPPVIDCQVRP